MEFGNRHYRTQSGTPSRAGRTMTETAIQVFKPAAALINQAQFRQLAGVPPEAEWFANLTNRNSRLAYRKDVGQFVQFLGIQNHIELRTVTRAHVIAWRKDLKWQQLGPATIRRKLSAVGALVNDNYSSPQCQLKLTVTPAYLWVVFQSFIHCRSPSGPAPSAERSLWRRQAPKTQRS